LGLSVALVEESLVGGTCLHRGCIPTKTLLQSVRQFELIKRSNTFGVIVPGVPQFSFSEVQARKDALIARLQLSMEAQLSGVELVKETAQVLDKDCVRTGTSELKARYLLLACGSRPATLPGFEFDAQTVLSSDDILKTAEVPKTLLIIGGGVIGCEFAGLFSSLGTEVTIAEITAQLLPGADFDVAKKLESAFRKRRIQVKLSCDAHTLERSGFEKILVCVGRAPRLESLKNLQVAIDKKGVVVDDYLRTSAPTVFAAGDCTGKLMLAHFAGYQGTRAIENMADPGHLRKADTAAVPSCVYTHPEVASVGCTEAAAGAANRSVEVRKFDFLGLGMARIMDETEGFIKVLNDAKTGEIIGASIVGARATELIGIFGVAVSAKLSIARLRETIFAHPTFSEAIAEAVHKA
ncbi:MAG: FAD-dependent oxidoreductase, partial [Candidatus Omnitrophica bacterium]|nr:FAD-dependent oxidoreductase [Candidatus Omnitrophota bacterium]